MLRPNFLVTILGLIAAFLTGCGVVPVFRPNTEGIVGVRGHIQTRIESDARHFSVRSGGEIVGAKKNHGSESWRKIGEFSTSHFAVALFAPEDEAILFDTAMRVPVAIASSKRGLSDLDILHAGFLKSNKALMEMLGTRTVKSQFNIYYSRPEAPARVPFTDWQPGPIVDPVKLNLAIIMPVRANGQSLLKPEDREAWHTAVVSGFAHEYMHVVQANAPTPPRPALADEFVAYAVGDCITAILHGKFSEASRKSGMEVAEVYFQKGKRYYLDQPFALSDTAGDLAALAGSLFFSRPELKDATLTHWQQIAPAYCKYIANAVPDFSTVEGGLDWIEKHVYRAKLDFLAPEDH